MRTKMTPLEAVKEFYRENARNRRSTASAKRFVRACRAVGLNDADLIAALHFYDYCAADGVPYSNFIKRVWP